MRNRHQNRQIPYPLKARVSQLPVIDISLIKTPVAGHPE